MRDDYARAYEALSERHWWWRARREWLLEQVEALAPEGGWSRILDVGCGDGLWFRDLDRFGSVEGVERDSSVVTSRSREEGRIHVRPFDESFRPGRRYGLILFLDVLEHMEDPAGALAHAAHLLASGGVILVTVPAFELLWTLHDDLNGHLRRYRRTSLSTTAARAGLEVRRMRYFFHWVFVAKLFLRLFEAVSGGDPRTPSVPPRPVNELLYRVSRLEQRLPGTRFLPVGSSLLLVAGEPAGG